MRNALLLLFLISLSVPKAYSQIKYPYPVKGITISLDGANARMAYMDVSAPTPNGRSILLLHGKNFTGLYWKSVIDFFTKAGYRVIAPDQIGWGQSSKPDMKYSFELLANNNRILLDSLHIEKISVIGHSMGGMLATRFALMYPGRTSALVLEDPLGMEDYKKFVPFVGLEKMYKKELNASYASYKKYQAGYYPVWKPEYELYVKAQADVLKQQDFNSVAYVNALTYQMIYEGPVLYEFKNLSIPVLIIVGEVDKTIPNKELLNPQQLKQHGNFSLLAKKTRALVHDCQLIILPGVGHIPHLQTGTLFNRQVFTFLQKQVK